MCLQRRQRLPLLDDRNAIVVGLLLFDRTGSVDHWTVFDAAVFFQHLGNNGVELPQEIVSMSGTQFDPHVARALMRVALGRLRWATGPLAAIGQFPWSRGLPALGRDVVTLAASSAIMTTSLVTGVVPSPADLPTREVVEVVIAGAGLSGDVVDAIVAAGEPTTEPDAASGESTPSSPALPGETTTTQLIPEAPTPPLAGPTTTTTTSTMPAVSPPATAQPGIVYERRVDWVAV